MKEFEGLKVPSEGIQDKDSVRCDDICECERIECIKCIFGKGNEIKRSKFILCYKTPITENILPFGMLSEEKQEELRKAEVINNGENSIQFFNGEYFDDFIGFNSKCSWFTNTVYRLNPQWKPKKMRAMTLSEIWDKRKEWEFRFEYRFKTEEYISLVIKKVVNIDDKIIYIQIGNWNLEKVTDDLKYRPIGSSEEFKPLPEMECE